jgi:AcrR family transcriptional regulator
MNYAEFQKRFTFSREDLYRVVLSDHRDIIRVKKEERAVRNLELIFGAVLKISNAKGFQAMSMRDLSRETGMSMGALYAYFSSKEELLEMLQTRRRTITRHILEESIAAEKTPADRLRAAILTHLYLSEAMQPWFYFSYMEAKHLSPAEQKKAVVSELYTEKLLTDILEEGQRCGSFAAHEARMTAAVIKAMLQDWYLKRRKYARRGVTVEQFGRFLLEFIGAFINADPDGGRSSGRKAFHA